MKKIFVIIISLLILGTGVGVNNFIDSSSSLKGSNTATDKKVIQQEKIKKDKSTEKVEKEEIEEDDEEKSTETVEESNSYENNQTSSSNYSSNGSSYSNSNTQSNSNSQSNSVNNNSNYVPERVTEWSKLGISEYDYYNTPAPNEGEIATGVSDCDSVGASITNKYGLITHSGDVRSYSEKYLGCWITIWFNDGSYLFYNSFKARESRGEFNYLLAP